MELNANFSLAARPPAQKIGVAGWDAKVFSADSAPQLPPAPTPEQLLARPFPPEILRFYLTKRQAQKEGADADGREVWRYALHGNWREVKIPLPGDIPQKEQEAVDEIVSVEGTSDASVRLAIAQVASANWHEFLRGVAGQAGAMSETPASCNSAAGNVTQANRPPTPQIPPLLQNLLTPAPEPAPVEKSRPAPGFAKEDFLRSCGAVDFLCEAADLIKQRGKEYDRVTGAADDPAPEERSFARVAAAFNAVHDTALTPAQVCHLLALLKQVRLFTAPTFHRDSAADGVAYMALLAEEKSMEP